MWPMKIKTSGKRSGLPVQKYDRVLKEVVLLLEASRRKSIQVINNVMTATYWEIGRRIVSIEFEGKDRAEYGKRVIEKLASDLTARFGRGFGRSNLFQMRAFYLAFQKVQTAS